MAPHEVAGVQQYLAGSGPVDSCNDGEGNSALFPLVAKVSGSGGLAHALAEQAESGTSNITSISAIDVKTALQGVGGASIPSQKDRTQSKWILESNAQFSTAITLCLKARILQRAAAKPCGTWLSPEQVASSMIVDGFSRQLIDLQTAIEEAKKLKASSVEVNKVLMRISQSNDAPTDKAIAKVIVPKVLNYVEMVDDAILVMEGLLNVGGKRACKYLLQAAKDVQQFFPRRFQDLLWHCGSQATQSSADQEAYAQGLGQGLGGDHKAQ